MSVIKIYQDRVCRLEYQYVFCIESEPFVNCATYKDPMSNRVRGPYNVEDETLIYEVDHGKKSQEDIS